MQSPLSYATLHGMALRKTLYVLTPWNVSAPRDNIMCVVILKKPFIRSLPEPLWYTHARKIRSSEVSFNILL
jgi:hypothetical protein